MARRTIYQLMKTVPPKSRDLPWLIVKLIAGPDIAEQVQIVTQYFPAPPVHADLAKQVDAMKERGTYCCPIWPDKCEGESS